MYDIRESLLASLQSHFSLDCKIEIEVEWDARDFDLFIGQGGSDFHYEQVYRTNFTNDFAVIRSSGKLKTIIMISSEEVNDPRHKITHRIERTTGEAVSGALIIRTLLKLGLYEVGY